MRDKENRRDIVYFLHNRLNHFQLFNGIHISTLYTRVSCGKDYLEDIIDTELSSPPFIVPPSHTLTIGRQKNLIGKPRQRSPIPLIDIPVSPFCLDGDAESPSTPSFSKRRGKKSAELTQNEFSLTDMTEHGRNRSTSMFETLNSPNEPIVSPFDLDEEKPVRRNRTFSVHDVILHHQKSVNEPKEVKECEDDHPPAVCLDSFSYL